MWFQTLKTRQSVRNFASKNSQGSFVGLEYTDKKTEVHCLKREITPLSLEEGTTVGFVTHDNGGISIVALSQCGKGKTCIELRAWDATNSLGFTAKEIAAQDLQGNVVNDGKFKALINLLETLPGVPVGLKVDCFKEFLAVAVVTGIIIMWRCKKVDHVTTSFELLSVMKSSMTIQDIALVDSEKSSKKCPPSILVGEPGGIRVFSVAQSSDVTSDVDFKFVSTLVPFPSPNIGSTVQDIQRISPTACILSDSSGRLWYMNPPLLEEIMLPSSKGGHSVFAAQPKYGHVEGWLATVDQGQTVNLFKLSDAIESTESGLIVQPWHCFMAPHPLSALSFIDFNVLAGASNSNKSVLLWVGIDNIGTKRLETG